MSTLFERANAIQQLNTQRQFAAQDAAIAKAEAFWNRVPTAAQSFLDHQYAAQDAAIERGKSDGALGVLGLTPETLNEPATVAPKRNSSPTARDYAVTPVSPSTFDFLNAELAEHYGMSKTTAYQEALSNTSYQRAVQDMRAAGLNPAVMFGSGRASGANASTYASQAGSGSGGSGRRRSGGSSGNGDLFTPGMYAGLSTIGGLIGVATTKRPDGYWIGSQTTQGAMQLMNAVYKAKK